MLKEKVMDRKERFKTQGYQPDEGEKKEIDARKARFGTENE
jgi:hypothetical protein